MIGFLVLLGAAFWFDAHAGEIAGELGAAKGTGGASAVTEPLVQQPHASR